MDKNKYWEITRSDWYGTSQVLFVFIAVIMISSVFLLARYWYLWIMIIAGVLVLLVVWHAKKIFPTSVPDAAKCSRFQNLKISSVPMV
ncbi:hypothetical protein [Methanosarcina barkeri]|uniref:hypothetical protein n=1 Tax=Methanosarcina barkeri TaxID=2208 RepID=UPI000ABA0B54|nr:hypothetical protein [Methanosarcina barkeri]